MQSLTQGHLADIIPLTHKPYSDFKIRQSRLVMQHYEFIEPLDQMTYHSQS
jgi:hypothetical protein